MSLQDIKAHKIKFASMRLEIAKLRVMYRDVLRKQRRTKQSYLTITKGVL